MDMDNIGQKSLISTFKYLFESKKGADITFVVHGKDIAAHRLVASSRSPVFEAMIASDLAPPDGKHAIDDPEITFDDFNNFLEFLYTDSCAITGGNIQKLIYLGDLYNVEYLIVQCVKIIDEKFSAGAMLKFAELGLFYGQSCPLLDMCISKLPIIIAHWSLKYPTKDGDQWISPELALKIVEKCPRTEVLTEDILFKKIYEWALKGQAIMKIEDIKAALSPLIPFIKFEDLSAITLATVVRDNKLLDPENLANVLSAAVKLTEGDQRLPRKRKMSSNDSDGVPSKMRWTPSYEPTSLATSPVSSPCYSPASPATSPVLSPSCEPASPAPTSPKKKRSKNNMKKKRKMSPASKTSRYTLATPSYEPSSPNYIPSSPSYTPTSPR